MDPQERLDAITSECSGQQRRGWWQLEQQQQQQQQQQLCNPCCWQGTKAGCLVPTLCTCAWPYEAYASPHGTGTCYLIRSREHSQSQPCRAVH
jgi:hypothetical protein